MINSLQVFDIERFAINDGPGIRTAVFLQGCPMRCPWCANPESWQSEAQLMYTESKCVKCGRCVSACPAKAIELVAGRLKIERAVCKECAAATGCAAPAGCVTSAGCVECVNACPQSTLRIAGKEIKIKEIMDIVLRDRDYYHNSGGGITLSGGEPLLQFEGALDLLIQSREAGLHTAVETSGNIDQPLFQKTIPFVDLFLFDIKHIDAKKIKDTTSGDLSLILSNMRFVCEQSPDKIILRIPVIPGFNDNQETLQGIFQIAVDYNISTINLLPYHPLGKNKFAQLGIDYPYNDDLPMMKHEQLIPYIDRAQTMGLTALVS